MFPVQAEATVVKFVEVLGVERRCNTGPNNSIEIVHFWIATLHPVR